MKIIINDIFKGKEIELTATLSTEHTCSSYGMPVMLIKEWGDQNSSLMSYENWMLGAARVVEMQDEKEEALFLSWIENLNRMLP